MNDKNNIGEWLEQVYVRKALKHILTIIKYSTVINIEVEAPHKAAILCFMRKHMRHIPFKRVALEYNITFRF